MSHDRVTATAAQATHPSTVCVGTAPGGLRRSLDGGAARTPIFNSAASVANGSLALLHSNPSILYLGTREARLLADS